MKKLTFLALFAFAITMLTSCQVIAGIFKAGMWTGIITVVVVIVLVIWLFMKMINRPRE